MSVVEFADANGRRKFQPALGDGRVLWRRTSMATGQTLKVWRRDMSWVYDPTAPVLYRSRARAERVARRQLAREARLYNRYYGETAP